jgi:hypothetical protein
VQRTAWGVELDARADGSVGPDSTVIEGTSRAETVNVRTTPVALALGAGGSEAGVGLAAETRQQELFPGAS